MLDYLLLVTCMVEDGRGLMLDCLLLLVKSQMEDCACWNQIQQNQIFNSMSSQISILLFLV
jgi:hypothetical protein